MVYECILISKTFGWYQLIPSHHPKHQIIHLQCRNGEKSQHFIQRMSFLSSRTCDRVDINQLSWQFKKTQEKKVYVTQSQKCSRYLGCVPCPMYAENWTAELCIIVTRPEPGSRNKCITNLFLAPCFGCIFLLIQSWLMYKIFGW